MVSEEELKQMEEAEGLLAPEEEMGETPVDEYKELAQEMIEEAEEDLTEEQQYKSEQESILSELAYTLDRKRHDYAARRVHAEQRWIRSLEMYYGNDSGTFSTNDPYSIKTEEMPGNRKRPRVNIVRNKCRLAITKLEELIFGANGKDYRLSPTPAPELVDGMNDDSPLADERTGQLMQGPDGQPLTVKKVAENVLQKAYRKSEKMQRIIDDQLIEGNYAKEAKKALKDYVILGTGILKGPILEAKRRVRYSQTEDGETFSMSKRMEVDTLPVFKRVDPWLFFPDPEATSPEQISDSFELIPMSRKQLIRLQDHPLFMADKIKKALELGTSTTAEEGMTDRMQMFDTHERLKNKYHVWAYYGPMDRETLEIFSEDLGEAPDESEDIIMAEVWMCNNQIIRINPCLIEGDDDIPYAIDTWEEDETTVFGVSLPETLYDHQRVAQKTWEMILDNSGLSVGPQAVINKRMIKPANGNWDLEPLKVWFMTEYGEKASDAMFFFDIPSNAGNLQAIHEMARQFADEESATPLAVQTAQSAQAVPSATGLAMLFNSSSVLQKADSRSWGENITVPVIERLYHFNMQDPDIPADAKGDFEIKVTPMANIIGEQLQAQDLERLSMLAMQEPYAAYVNHEELFRAGVEQMHVDADRFLKTPEQIRQEQEAAAQQPQQDPEMLKLELKKQELELERMKIEADAKRRQYEVEQRVRQRDEELKIRLYEAQERQQQALANVLNSQRMVEIQLMKLAEEKNKTIAELEASLGMKEMQEETKKFIAGITADIEANKIQAQQEIAAMKAINKGGTNE